MAIIAPERGGTLTALVGAVRAADPDVRDVVLIGSAVYAPELARDYDLVVTTESREAEDELRNRLWDVLGDVSGKSVDLILRHPGEEISRGIACGILSGWILYGQRGIAGEARHYFEEGGGAVASFDEAKMKIMVADDTFKRAEEVKMVELRYAYYETAFDCLFHGARIAALTFLARDDARWGGLKKELPSPFGERFKETTDTLHVYYAYDKKYPKGRQEIRQEFLNWKEKVERFVGELRERTLGCGKEPLANKA